MGFFAIAVHVQLKYIEHFYNVAAFIYVNEQDYHELSRHVAPSVTMDDKDEYAKRFDNLMYALILAQMEAL